MELRVWSLHSGKASHDALSIGWLKLPHQHACQDNAEFDVTGMLNVYPVVTQRGRFRCVLGEVGKEIFCRLLVYKSYFVRSRISNNFIVTIRPNA